MGAGRFDRIVQFRRYVAVDDGLSEVLNWSDYGDPVRAEKLDVSDAERSRASEVQASITSRFRVRYSAFTSGLTPKDELSCEGQAYEITGIKEVSTRRRFFEISAAIRTDQT